MFPMTMDFGYMSWWMLGSFAFWILLLVLAVGVLTRLGRHGDDALRILDERLARGEIDMDEYRSRRSLLAQ